MLPKKFLPKKKENKMKYEGNVINARKFFLKDKKNNLKFLLKTRYDWIDNNINKYITLLKEDKLLSKRVEDIYEEVLEEEKQKKWGKKKIATATARKRAKKITHGMNDILQLTDNGYQSNISDQWWDWWLNKATSRYVKLVDEDRYEEDQLWYEPSAEQIDKIDQWLRSRGRKKMDFSKFKV